MAVALSVLVVTRAESGGSPRKCDDLVVAVVRGRRILDSPTQRPRCCKPPTG
ncbi:hypothetical protein [Kitasatospora acidiphila]|uniref:hypothetical protein n=1 Tax=Kitasatospora acidiphila TaxID=2567942 RepID=UPI003C72BF02